MPVQNYHKHSERSNPIVIDSVAKNEDYCKRAVEVGASIISSCEHGTQGDYRECADLAEKYGLKWRYVTETYFVKDRFQKDDTNCHLILAAKTEKGIGDLNEALTEANITGYYDGRPRVDLDIVMGLNPKDVFVTTACVAGVFRYGYEEAERLIKMFHEHFGESFMLEVQAHNTKQQIEVNLFLLRLYRRYGIPLICGLDSHYIYPEDKVLRDQRLEANNMKYPDEEGCSLDYPDDDEIYRRFLEQGVLSPAQIKEAMDNTNIFLTFEDVTFDKSKKLPNIYPELTQEERNQKYVELVYSQWEKKKQSIPPSEWPRYEEGIKYETDTITSTNMSDYFLVDYELVKRGKELGGVLTRTGRGSGPSYYTNSLLGFSSIDRFALPVTMYPDRFISADRIKSGSVPDLDLNVADQEPFAKAQEEVLGEWHSAPMVAFGTLKRSGAWKMYCRAEKVPFETANQVSDFLKDYEKALKYADDDEKDQIDVNDYVPAEFQDILAQSEKYLGIIDNISPHPCGYLLCQKDIRREVGLFRISSRTGQKKTVFAAFIDGVTAEKYGYLKNDLLKVDVVKVNADAYRRIGMPQPSVPELINMVSGDSSTWDLYSNGCTMGLNQVERPKSREKVMRYKPKNVSELSAFVAGIRPGFKSMIDKLLDRQYFEYGVPVLDRLLQTPEMRSSFVLYQEQMMSVLQYGGFTASESYSAIKAIAKKHPEKVLPLKSRFMKGFSERLMTEEKTSLDIANETTDKVWTIISDACSYSFNSCISQNTVIMRSSGSKHNPLTVGEMYRICHDREYAKKTGHKDLHSKYKSYGYGSSLSLCTDGRIHPNKIVDIRDQGIRKIYSVKLESGKEIRCTINHKFPVGSYDNLVLLSDLKVGDELFVSAGYEKNQIVHRFTDGEEKNLPKKGEQGFQKKENPATVLFRNYRLSCVESKKPCEECGREYTEDCRFELHHKDGDSTHNELSNYAWLCVSCHKKAHYGLLDRRKRFEKGYPVLTEKIVSIEEDGEEHVYDVEMADPYHNFVIDNGIVTGNSHSVSVALDSLYSAWAKAHHPLEFYASLLTNYSDKKDKDRAALAKLEMKKYFGINLVPCKFGQDNRGYYIDFQNNSLSNAIASIKGVSQLVAEELYKMRNNEYEDFTSFLLDAVSSHTVFDKTNLTALIKLGYFSCFGKRAKLLKIYQEFYSGPIQYKKTYVEKTKEKRIAALKELEMSLPDEDLPPEEVLSIEQSLYGAPLSTFPELKGEYVVTDVDDHWSPKIDLYNAATGTNGRVKIRRRGYNLHPLQQGDVLRMVGWNKREASMYKEGKRLPIKGVYDIWMNDYEMKFMTERKEKKTKEKK